ncbi:MAG: ATP phosphoribosyltransferase, partial [Sphingobacteriales bacterium]
LDDEKSEILRRLTFRMEAVLRARSAKYILMNVPNDRIDAVTSLLPVLKSPTVLPLALPGWSSLHSVIAEDQFWEVIDQLKLAGAEGILVVPVEKMVV